MRRFGAFLLTVFLLFVLCACELSHEAPAVGKMRILVYGNDYSYGNLVYYSNGTQVMTDKGPASAGKLYKTVNDAVQVGRALAELAEKAHLEHEEHYLTETSDVTETRLVSELEGLAAVASERDITIIYYSGHGYGIKSKMDYGYDTSTCSYLVPRFAAHPESNVLFPISEFLELVNAIKGVKVVIGDFCYSGGLVQTGNVSVTSGEYLPMDPVTLFAKYRDDICESSSLFCLSAAKYNELSYEKNSLLHGNFTNALLEALGWDEENQCLKAAAAEKDNMITLFEIAKFVTANDGESKQTPMVSGGSNDIILFSF